MFLSFLFFAFLAYLAFRLVFDFIVPVYRTTRQVRQRFREMNEHLRNQQGTSTPPPPPQGKTQPAAGQKSTLGEYIDFEEVKD